MRKKTKIICTIGPASESPAVLKKLVKGGANVFRLNFSHGDHAEHAKRIQDIQTLRKEMNMPIGIMLDTKGPEIRIKTFQQTPVELAEGDTFTLTTRDVEGTKEIVSITYEGLPQDVQPGTVILIDDGLVAMEVLEVKDGTDIVCKVKNGGQLSNRKGVNVPGVYPAGDRFYRCFFYPQSTGCAGDPPAITGKWRRRHPDHQQDRMPSSHCKH